MSTETSVEAEKIVNMTLINALKEMEENGKRILKETCRTTQTPPVERKFVVRNRGIIRNAEPAPITCVVTERCQAPDQIVDVTVSFVYFNSS